jgi:hypothetical protein
MIRHIPQIALVSDRITLGIEAQATKHDSS